MSPPCLPEFAYDLPVRSVGWWRPLASVIAVAAGVWLVLFTCGAPTQQSGAPSQLAQASHGPIFGPGPSLKDIATGAKAEGEVHVAFAGDLPEAWRLKFEQAVSKQFGIGLSLKVDTQKPDVLIATDVDLAARRGELTSHEWQILFGAVPESVYFDGDAVNFAQQSIVPILSSRGAAAAAWEGLTDGRLSGRLGSSPSADVWGRLYYSWGPEKTDAFVKALAQQRPQRGSDSELVQWLQQGKIDAVAGAPSSLADRGSGLVAADATPVVLRSTLAATLAKAQHPNAAELFVGFLLTDEGQKLWADYSGQSSAYVTGSPLANYITGHRYVLVDQGVLMKELPGRTAGYAKLLGWSN